MTDHPHSDDPVAAAETELEDAQTALATLEGDHVDGKNITPAQFDRAEQRVSMARRGIDRAKRMVQRRKEVEHDTEVQRIDAAVAEHNTAARIAPVRDAYAAAVDAVQAFLTVHRDYQRDAGRLEGRAKRANHRVRVTRLDSGAHGKPWLEQLLRDAQHGYDVGPINAGVYAGHALMPERDRLESLRRFLEGQRRNGHDEQREQRITRITARIEEIDQNTPED